jgi:hypothetical protein
VGVPHLFGGDLLEYLLQPRHVRLLDPHRDPLPVEVLLERQDDVIRNDDGDAPDLDALKDARAPRGPPQGAQAKGGLDHVLQVGGGRLVADVEVGVVRKGLPDGETNAPGKKRVKSWVKSWLKRWLERWLQR